MNGWFRVTWRFSYFVVATIFHLAVYYSLVLFGVPARESARRLKYRWLADVPDALGITMTAHGIPYSGTCLYVANHISYLDPVLILMKVNALIVAKKEVSRWPLIGTGGLIIGTIYVDRDEKTSRLKTAHAIRSSLELGNSVLIFPEGTTSTGETLLPFRPRSFEAALQAGVPVQPIYISYRDPEVSFTGDQTFLPHFFRLFRKRRIHGDIFFGPVLTGENTCELSGQWISSRLNPLISEPA